MKNLDKTQVYDLRGITEKQAKELYDWLRDYDRVWDEWGYRCVIGDDSLEYFRTEWRLSDNNPTTHISTLFEKSYEQQLQEAKNQLERYKKEVERMENESKPKVGDVCKFWNDVESDFVIGILTDIDDVDYIYKTGEYYWFKNAIKVTDQEIVDILFNKSC